MSQIQVYEAGTGPGPGPILTLQGNIGGPVAPNGLGNIFVEGGTGVVVDGTLAANTLTIDIPGGGFSWINVTAGAVNLAPGTGYIIDFGAGVVATLPINAALGDTYRILGRGVGLWRIAQRAGQQCVLNVAAPAIANNFYTTAGVGGQVQAQDQWDAVDIICVIANVGFKIIPLTGNLNFI